MKGVAADIERRVYELGGAAPAVIALVIVPGHEEEMAPEITLV